MRKGHTNFSRALKDQKYIKQSCQFQIVSVEALSISSHENKLQDFFLLLRSLQCKLRSDTSKLEGFTGGQTGVKNWHYVLTNLW